MTSAFERLSHSSCLHPDRQKDSEFWQQWISYQDELYRDCLHWMRNPTEAEDVLSQAMLKAWHQVKTSAHAIANFKGWVKRLIKNLCMDIHRQRHTEKTALQDIQAIAPQGEWANQGENPVHYAMHSEQEKFFENSINGLSPKLRETWILYHENDESYQAILEPLKISYSTARKRISDARSILHQQWLQYTSAEENPRPASLNPTQTQQKTQQTPVKPPTTIQPVTQETLEPAKEPFEQNQPLLEESAQGDNPPSPPLPVAVQTVVTPNPVFKGLEKRIVGAQCAGPPEAYRIAPLPIPLDPAHFYRLIRTGFRITPNPVVSSRFSLLAPEGGLRPCSPTLSYGTLREQNARFTDSRIPSAISVGAIRASPPQIRQPPTRCGSPALISPPSIGPHPRKVKLPENRLANGVDKNKVLPIQFTLPIGKAVFAPNSISSGSSVIPIKIGIPKILRGPLLPPLPTPAAIPNKFRVLREQCIKFHILTTVLLPPLQKRVEQFSRVWMDSGGICCLNHYKIRD